MTAGMDFERGGERRYHRSVESQPGVRNHRYPPLPHGRGSASKRSRDREGAVVELCGTALFVRGCSENADADSAKLVRGVAISTDLSMTGRLFTPNDEKSEGRRLCGGAGLQPARGIQPRSGRRRLKPVRRLKVRPTTSHLVRAFSEQPRMKRAAIGRAHRSLAWPLSSFAVRRRGRGGRFSSLRVNRLPVIEKSGWMGGAEQRYHRFLTVAAPTRNRAATVRERWCQDSFHRKPEMTVCKSERSACLCGLARHAFQQEHRYHRSLTVAAPFEGWAPFAEGMR
jgi:hypothetical protein